MSNFKRNLRNDDGSIETLLITSNDNRCPLDSSKTYKLVNHTQKKENKFVNKFKNSIFGAEIGVKAAGFSNIATLATIIAVGTLLIMYFSWKI